MMDTKTISIIGLILLPCLGLSQGNNQELDCKSMMDRGDRLYSQPEGERDLDKILTEYLNALNCDSKLALQLGPKIQQVFLDIEEQKRTAIANEIAAKEASAEAIKQRDIARRQARESSARALAAQARQAYSTDHTIALNLAYEAIKTAPLPEPYQALADISKNRESNFYAKSLDGHRGIITDVAYSPNGKYIISASRDSTAIIWDVKTGAKVKILKGHPSIVLSVAFSLDGKYAITGGFGAALLWELFDGDTTVVTGNLIRKFKLPIAQCVAISPDNSYVLTGGREIRLWNIETGLMERPLGNHRHPGQAPSQLPTDLVYAIDFSPNGKIFLSAGYDGKVKLWSTNKYDSLGSFVAQERGAISDAVFIDNERIATGGGDGKVRIWSVDGNEELTLEGHLGSVESIAVSNDKKYIFSGSWDNRVKRWRVEDGTEMNTYFGHDNFVNAVAFSPINDQFISAGRDMRIRVWNIVPRSEKYTRLPGHDDYVEQVAFSANGKYILGGSTDGTVILWETYRDELGLLNGKVIKKITGHQRKITDVAFSPDSKFLLTGGGWENNNALLFNLEGQLTRRFEGGHTESVTAVAFSPNGQYVLTASSDATAVLWSAKDASKIAVLKGHEEGISCAGFSNDNQMIFTGSQDGLLILWDLKSRKELRRIKTETWIDAAAISPDGKLIAISKAVEAGTGVWNTASGTLEFTLGPFEGSVGAVAFTPDGKQVVTGDRNSEAKLWEVYKSDKKSYSGQEVGSFSNYLTVSDLAISPDGQNLIAAGDSSPYIWNNEGYQTLLENGAIYRLNEAERKQYAITTNSTVAKSTSAGASQDYGVSLASFFRLEDAEAHMKLLQEKGLEKLFISDFIHPNGTAYKRVVQGTFSEKGAAMNELKRIQKQYDLEGFVVKVE